ncbi:MAG: septum formation initiator family protein [Bacteroidales bacterium]|jgi:cell division protein FtsB|nr:septum formation initiator family protein [Bacteroidales bacterium]
MNTALKIWKTILPYIKNKYIITFLVFLIWLLFFDRNNLVDRIQEINHYNQLEKDKHYFKERIDADSRRLEQLKTNNKNLEKFAREQYYMKKADEDIFVVVEEN